MNALKRSDPMGLLGLARRAGALAPGIGAAREALRTGSARLVVLAADAAPGQLDKVKALVERRRVPARWVDTRLELGRAVGLPSASAVAVIRHTFAEQLLERLPSTPPMDRGPTGGPRKPKEDSGIDAGR